ncbi:multiple cyclophane-containing RiPP AmcA [Streptosporangium sp. NBC_01469]|uniref:multiple cyclophane-containing RiPP AmcA n=1 Tax=Streptosporangium sp. NBC_01469 TaxID=2903898 RepID=UPI002E27C87F|nr:multiple cyclophane-containing RiPP AmcA [Streptosporangium sp. NBC_01469]
MTILERLTASDAPVVLELVFTNEGPPPAIDAAKWDNRPSWDNWAKNPAPFDNRPSWDNWNKKK